MKQSIGYYEFRKAFEDFGRSNHFPEGLINLFDYLEEYEESTGEEIDLDVVALCCDYTEEKLSVVLNEYDLESLEDLRNSTQVIMVDSETEEDPTIIYQNF